MTAVAVVHDYLTQRGGAERVALELVRTFPGAPLHTALWDPEGTFPEFAEGAIETLPVDRVGALRRRHRLAMPVLAPAFSAHLVRADVTVCSSSGWAHGVRVTGRKVVYCHAPARWLYQTDRYLRGFPPAAALALRALRPGLLVWDRRAAATAHRYLVNSTVVAGRVADAYGIDATVVPPPVAIDVAGPETAVPGVEPGFLLCVSRLLAYKNVDVVVAAAVRVGRPLVVVGTGPLEADLRRGAPEGVRFVGELSDPELRWLYRRSAALVAASYEDFGLTPIEAAAYGKPTVALRAGGYLDTIVEGRTGLFFDRPEPAAVAAGLRSLPTVGWDPAAIVAHAGTFSTARFSAALRDIVAEEAAVLRRPGT